MKAPNEKQMIESIDKFANGEKLVNLFKECKTDRTNFNHALKKYDLDAKYTRARELHGDGFNDEIEVIKTDLQKGKIDASSARVLIDTIKWQASKFYPKMYGDKATLDVVLPEKIKSITFDE